MDDRTKWCTRCESEKALFEFSNRKAAPDGLQNYCKECQRTYRQRRVASGEDDQAGRWKRYYEKHRLHLITTKVALTQTRKLVLVSEHGGKCLRCGYSRNLSALDFHHRDPTTKEYLISKKLSSYGIARLRIEAAKCDLLCSNCHREETHPDLMIEANVLEPAA